MMPGAMSESSALLGMEFSALLSDMDWICQHFEEFVSEQRKNLELVHTSLQITMLSMIEQKLTILSQMEAVGNQLRDQLNAISEYNYLSFQNFKGEINSLVQEIIGITSQTADTSDDSEPMKKKVTDGVSNILHKNNRIKFSLKKVDVIPYPLASPILGEIQCEEESVDLAIAYASKEDPASCIQDEDLVLQSDEKPPSEDASEKSEEAKLSSDESDQDSGPSDPLECPKEEIGTTPNQQQMTSPLPTTSIWKPMILSLMPYAESIPGQNKFSAKLLKSSPTERKHLSASSPTDVPLEVHVHESSDQNWKTSVKVSQQLTYVGASKGESNIVPFSTPGKLVKQFGKCGSGRSELNRPLGIHATTLGLIYIVDFGNHRLQVMDGNGSIQQQIALRAKNYFDVAVNNQGLVALTNSTDGTVEIYNRHGRFLQIISSNFGDPRGITVNHQDEFIVADMKQGTLWALTIDPSSGYLMKSTIVHGFNNPYIVNSNNQGLLVVSERGLNEESCVKVLSKDWQILKVVGLKESPGPILYNPWGVCIDNEGGVLVADCGKTNSLVYYPLKKPAHVILIEGLCSPRGLALWQDHLLLVVDSMNNCIKLFQYD